MSEIIWRSVLEQLRASVSSSAFETWLTDTQFLSSDHGVFLIGCRDANARDWLQDRLLSTIERLLTERLNRSVSVSFVVAGNQVDESAADSEQRKLADDDVQVEAVWDSVYEQVVRPEKAIAVNAYFLRHLQQLGPELGWLYIGFRQAAYSSGGRNGNQTARFAGKTVAALSGMSERTFWRRVGSQNTWQQMAGLVNLVGEKPLWNEKSATPKRLPRKYSVSMTLPLTATDARSLMRWFSAHWDAGNLAGVLNLACQTPLEEIIPANAAQVVDREPMPVSQIVRELFSENIPEAELKALAEKLQMHLMPPGDLLMISLFFIEHVLPHLGAGPGWMLTILRDRCWVNPENGEARNRVMVKGGYAEIAGWLGSDRPLTVYEWLNGKQKNFLPSKEGEGGKKPNPKAGKFLNSPLRVYLREVTGQKAVSFRDDPREFDVLLEEIPQEIMAAIVLQKRPHLYATDSIVVTQLSHGLYATDSIAITQLSHGLYATDSIAVTQLADDLYAIDSIGFTQLSDDLYAIDSIAVTQLADDLYANGRVFKLLSSLKPALKTLLTTTTENSKNLETPAPETQKPVVVVDKDSKTTPTEKVETAEASETAKPAAVDTWDLNSIFHANGVSQKKQKQLLNSGATELAFVSWLLYGFTPEGKGLTNLVGNAIQSTLDSPQAGAGGICDLLAGYGPEKLSSLLADSICGVKLTDRNFLSAFSQLSVAQKQDLLLRLGQKPLDAPERIEHIPVYERPASPESPITDPAQVYELLRSRSRDSKKPERKPNHAATI